MKRIFFEIIAVAILLIIVAISCKKETEEIEKGVVIDGVRWATRNVDKPGTFAKNPEDPGMFYQWNSKIGWSATDPMINSDGDTTWNNPTPAGDTWEKVNDPCPTGWRVPTHGELESLVTAGSHWTTKNGVNGRVFGGDGYTVFLPAAGTRSINENIDIIGNGCLWNVGNYGSYWSCTPDSDYSARFMFFGGEGVYTANSLYRNAGFSVRCVAE